MLWIFVVIYFEPLKLCLWLFKQVLTVFKSDNEINIAAAKQETGQKYELRSAKPELITNLWLSSKSTSAKLTRKKTKIGRKKENLINVAGLSPGLGPAASPASALAMALLGRG